MDLDGLLTQTADGVFAVTPDGKIALWNRAAEAILGYSAKEVLGRRCCDVLVGRDTAGNRLCYQGCHPMMLVQRGDLVQNFDMATRTKAGKPVWVNVSTVVVPGSRNGLQTIVHLIRDVTASHELEALVRERLAAPRPASSEGECPLGALTRREREVLRLMAQGASTRVMAQKLNVSPATVRNHVQNILGKVGAHSRLEAVAQATNSGLL
ncbi:MAG: LuxR C-terminal-related transcriptional regulator [Candidatus Methylomirabilia bacterium]